jgi:hypothetical protein
MANFAILRVAKLGNKGKVGAAGGHSYREREVPNADPKRTPLNVVLTGARSTAELHKAVKARIDLATHKTTDAVQCIEYVITGSPEAEVFKSPEETMAYFHDSLAFFRKMHGTDNVVSAVVHWDEETPHMHLYAVPIDVRGGKVRNYSVGDGRDPDGTPRRKTIQKTVGQQTWLSAAAFVGGAKKLTQLQTDFAEAIGPKYKLERGIEGSRETHQTVKSWYGKLPKPQADLQKLARPELEKFGRDAWLAAVRQKEMLKEQQEKAEMAKAEAEKKLDALRKQADTAVGELRKQIAQATEVIKGHEGEISGLASQIRDQASEFTAWITDVLERVWDALSSPEGVSAARAELEAATAALEASALPEPPELRIEVRELVDGTWRASVVDRDEREHWSAAEYEDAESAHYAAGAWIQQQTGQVMGM